MGPLFSLGLIAIGSALVFGLVFLIFKMSLRTAAALRRTSGFFIGMGAGSALSGGLLSLTIGTGATLTTKTQIIAFLVTVAVGALAGGCAFSYFVASKFD